MTTSRSDFSVLLVGNPNSGKTLLFNRLTGLRKKVANFPGVTVELSSGYSEMLEAEVIDFPGIYSLVPLSKDEEVAVNSLSLRLKEDRPQVVVCVLDVTRLERSLFLFLQLKQRCAEEKVPLVMLLNMVDQLAAHNLVFDLKLLERELGCPVIEVSARTKLGLNDLGKITKSAFQDNIIPVSHEPSETNALKIRAKDLARRVGVKGDLLLKSQYRIDKIVLSKAFGTIIFIFTMMFLFQAIFSWATPLMDGVEYLLFWLSGFVTKLFPTGPVSDFVNDALFGGFGSFLVFVPQIFVLTFIIGLLEDSGYLARAALICHKPLSFFGLSGRSFVPLLTGHACAIPAIFAARNIESPRRRMLTMMVVPLLSCSARLPVYGLFIAALIPSKTYLWGMVGLQGLGFFALYFLGLMTALFVSALADRTLLKQGGEAPFVLELPPYRLPHIFSLLRKAWDSSYAFVMKAGPVIFSVTVVIWFLGYFPVQGVLSESYLAHMGKWIEPVFSPLGIDWKFGVAILTSFLAREVFVGTLGTLMGVQDAGDDFHGLAEKLQMSGLTLGSGVALLVFYALAMQCVATLAVLKKELGSWKVPSLVFVAYSLLAYIAALIVYQLF